MATVNLTVGSTATYKHVSYNVGTLASYTNTSNTEQMIHSITIPVGTGSGSFYCGASVYGDGSPISTSFTCAGVTSETKSISHVVAAYNGYPPTSNMLATTFQFTNLKVASGVTVHFTVNTSGGSAFVWNGRAATAEVTSGYTVTFNLAGGTRTGGGALVQRVNSGGSATPPTCTRTGYTFKSWSGSYTNVTSDVTVTATWNRITYTISYNTAGGSGSFAAQMKNYGEDLTLHGAPAKSYKLTYNSNGGSLPTGTTNPATFACTFKGWKSSSGTIYSAGDVYSANASTTLTAQWTNPTVQTLPSPTRANYSFNGWYTAANSGTKVSSPLQLSQDITLYAQWTRLYKVSYDANGGGGAPDFQTKIHGTTLRLSDTQPYRWFSVDFDANGGQVSSSRKYVYCIFAGWNTQRDGSGAGYASGGNYSANSDITLYAQWTYPKLGDTPTATRAEYTFKGWYTHTAGGTKVSSDSEIHNDIILYAQWLTHYTITYNVNGGTGGPSSQDKLQGSSVILSTQRPTRSHTLTYNPNGGTVQPTSKSLACTFKEWNTSSNGSGTSYQPGQPYTSNSDVTLYAIWEFPKYGSLPTPSYGNRTFQGWYTSLSGSTQVTSTSTLNSDRTIYAHWLNHYTITYDANGGADAPDPQDKLQGTDIAITNAVPTRSHVLTYNPNGGTVSPRSVTRDCTFSGWNTAADGSGTSYRPGQRYSANASVILYAIWTFPKYGSLPTPTREDTTFQGWFNTGTGGTQVDANWVLNSNRTIYARWLNHYTIEYFANGGTNAPETQTKLQNQSTSLSNVTPTRSCTVTYDPNMGSVSPTHKTFSCDFVEWNTASDGSGTSFNPGDTYSTNADLTLYAIWRPATLGTSPTPTRLDCKFQGWTRTLNGSDTVTANLQFMSDLVIHAKWAYAVVIDGNDGTIFNTASGDVSTQMTLYKTHGAAFQIPDYLVSYIESDADATQSHEFLGYSTDASATSAVYHAGDQYTVDAPLKLYAVYRELTFTVTFIDGHSAEPLKICDNIVYGGAATPPNDPTWAGHTFKGWVGEYTNVRADQTVVASWGATPVWIMTEDGWVPYSPVERS